MKSTIATILLLATMAVATAPEIAVFTGRAESVTTISGKQAWNCEYRVRGNYTFWKLFVGRYCAGTINVE